MKAAFFLITAVAMAAPVFGKIWTRCGLAQEMYALGALMSELPQWTCIAEHESSYNTYVIGPTKPDGSNDYGIFQINDYYWCQPDSGNFSYNGCHVSCRAFLIHDVRYSVTCALKIKSQQGWTAWPSWEYCNGDLPSIDDCF